MNVGDYSFSWNKYGPYSLGLDSDAQNCSIRDERDVVFSSFAKQRFEKIKCYIEQRTGYSCVRWIECISSLLYLKNVFRYKEEELIYKLRSKKPYLSDEQDNERALSIIQEIQMGA